MNIQIFKRLLLQKLIHIKLQSVTLKCGTLSPKARYRK